MLKDYNTIYVSVGVIEQQTRRSKIFWTLRRGERFQKGAQNYENKIRCKIEYLF